MPRLFLIDTGLNRAEAVEVGESLDGFYERLNCDTFDVARRMIGGRPYDIFVDDIGLWRDPVIISAVTSEGEPALVGNLLIANYDHEGNTTSLSDEDIHHIMRNIGFIFFPDKKSVGRICLLNCD